MVVLGQYVIVLDHLDVYILPLAHDLTGIYYLQYSVVRKLGLRSV